MHHHRAPLRRRLVRLPGLQVLQQRLQSQHQLHHLVRRRPRKHLRPR
jgi:hypothetical protein